MTLDEFANFLNKVGYPGAIFLGAIFIVWKVTPPVCAIIMEILREFASIVKEINPAISEVKDSIKTVHTVLGTEMVKISDSTKLMAADFHSVSVRHGRAINKLADGVDILTDEDKRAMIFPLTQAAREHVN